MRSPSTQFITGFERLAVCLVAATCLSQSFSAGAAIVTRGPYLQLGTPTNLIVCWRTDVATDSVVHYGLDPGTLTLIEENPIATNSHAVLLSSLSPDTTYYYAVGSTSEVLAQGEDYAFHTAPPVGSTRPFRIWALGDFGFTNQSAIPVRDAYADFAGSRGADLFLMLGDNAYHGGGDAVWQVSVFETYDRFLRQTVTWSTIGNQETGGSSELSTSRPYLEVFHFPTQGEAGGVASGTEHYYSFDYANAHFICLDSMSSTRTPGGAMLNWLEADLAAVTSEWTIAFWHHPPYSKGSRDSDTQSEQIQMRTNAVRILEAHGVDLVLTGHSHSYERSYLIDGHYGLSTTFGTVHLRDGGDGRVDGAGAYHKNGPGPGSNQGAVYVVAGSGASLNPGALNHPAMFRSLMNLGSLVIDVHANRLEVKFIRETGAIDDYFTMTKGDAQPRLDTPVVGDGQVTLTWTSIADRTYRVRYADDPSDEVWEEFEGEVKAPGSRATWTGSVGSNGEWGYYRVFSEED